LQTSLSEVCGPENEQGDDRASWMCIALRFPQASCTCIQGLVDKIAKLVVTISG